VAKVELSEEEAIATLNHSALPTLVAEGRDDIIVLRRLEDKLSDFNLSVLPVGGREKVIRIYERRLELTSGLIRFFADKDAWIYTTVPNEYADPLICFTDGYSIENDMYRDGGLEKLLTAGERVIFREELGRFVRWYSLALTRHLADDTVPIATHPNMILDDAATYIAGCALQAGEVYPEALRATLLADYAKMLRGKSLLALLVRRLSHKNRHPRHSSKTLLEFGVVAEGPHLTQIVEWLRASLIPR
jgi:hypothetical protein